MQDLTYLTYAADELHYFITAYKTGFRYNAMVSQAQRICECYMKHLIQSKSLMNVSEIMRSHNLRAIYDEILSMDVLKQYGVPSDGMMKVESLTSKTLVLSSPETGKLSFRKY